MRRLSTRVLEHLHRLSLRFHLDRRTGAVSRDLERGTRSVSQILNYLAFSILPIMVEFGLVAFILLTQYNPVFALAMFGSVVVYVLVTFAITEWRMDFRHTMNRLDSEANSRAFDSLINYETVKYFGNERMELARYDTTLSDWEHWAVKSQTSMSLLNFGQGVVIALGMTLVMFLAMRGVASGEISLGDLVLLNAFMLQLFIPLGFLGIVYRQIKYALADMDLIFKLLEREPDVVDAQRATPMRVSGGTICFEAVEFGYQPERQILKGLSFTVPAGHKIAVVGHSGAGKSTLEFGSFIASTISTVVASRSTGRISATCPRTACAQPSGSSRRTPCCSMTPSTTTLPMGVRARAARTSNRRRHWPISRTSSNGCPMAGRRWSANVA
jgi:ATP-binding cassette subfamily B protein